MKTLEHLRGAHRRDDTIQEAPRRHDRRHWRELDWQTQQRGVEGDIWVEEVQNTHSSFHALWQSGVSNLL